MNPITAPHAMLYVGAGQFALCDWTDWPLVRGYWWHLTTDNGDVRYAQTWSTHSGATRKRITMHGLIFPVPEGFVSDHINGDGLDNRRENLRIATPLQNTWNRKPTKGRSAFKGVHWDKEVGTWRAVITEHGKPRTLGRFAREEDAAMAYTKAAERLHGEFAVTSSRNV